MFLKVVSLIMILTSLYLASVSTTSSIGISFSSLTYTCNKKIGTNCGIVWPSMVILRQSLDIGGYKIEGNKE